MKHGSYKECKTLGDYVIGYREGGVQPYVTWDRTPTDVDNAVFHSSYEDALEYLEGMRKWKEDEENGN